MPYNIEIIALGEDSYAGLVRSVAALNGLQNQYHFYLPSAAIQSDGIGFRRDRYLTLDIWDFLRDQRLRLGGNRPYIIAFVGKPLHSERLSNLFGSHRADEGLAVVTFDDVAQYVKEASRYYCYYMVRYTLSFINPNILVHEEDNRKSCYFHKKIYKPEIRASMDSGFICDDCMAKLDNPPVSASAHRLSSEEREALRKMLQYVSGELPFALIMKGGGVKGLAFAGALREIEKYYWFDRHVGTSAGAIAAVLLAASYTPDELTALLLEKDFRDFMDAPWWTLPFNLFISNGLYPGEAFRRWMADLLAKKLGNISEIQMKALKGAIVYAARHGSGTLVFDSLGERQDTVAAFAARCSMSIPFFFTPVSVDGRRVYDGGLRNNFPLTRFLAKDPRSNFLALYLGKRKDANNGSLVLRELFDIVVEGEDLQTVDTYRDKVIIIDTSPIGTIDFNLDANEKQFLLNIGKAAALRYLYDRKFDDGPSALEVGMAEREAEIFRERIISTRRYRHIKKIGRFFEYLITKIF